ncbi:hypothetical protein ACTMTJ_39080 [Phytohabitans sp. LJ34]|uniref:hypothetical protein n=1 Tax=Phytohabitans sp. LJ34 TaxID=3452217 RepID=UPI003F8B0B4E
MLYEFGPLQRRHTIAKILDQATAGTATTGPPTPEGPTVAECDAKLARYRVALDAGADPAVVAGWIAETQAERQRAKERQPSATTTNIATDIGRLTEEKIVAILDELGDLVTALREAQPEHKLEVYRSLGLRLTYLAETQTVRADIDLATHRWGSGRVRGGT